MGLLRLGAPCSGADAGSVQACNAPPSKGYAGASSSPLLPGLLPSLPARNCHGVCTRRSRLAQEGSNLLALVSLWPL